MNAFNKWNKKLYKVVDISQGMVTLQRENGSKFTISESEFRFSYIIEK